MLLHRLLTILDDGTLVTLMSLKLFGKRQGLPRL